MRRPRPSALTARSNNICKRRRFFELRQQSATAKAEAGNNGLELRWRVADSVVVVRVRVEEAAEPRGATDDGEKLQVTDAGNPEQLRVTRKLNPCSGETEIVVWPL